MKANNGRKALIAIAAAVAMCATTSCEECREVDRVVELHYINGEVETRIFRGVISCRPRLTQDRIPSYYDGCNFVRCVVRFRVLRVDTVPSAEKGGLL